MFFNSIWSFQFLFHKKIQRHVKKWGKQDRNMKVFAQKHDSFSAIKEIKVFGKERIYR